MQFLSVSENEGASAPLGHTKTGGIQDAYRFDHRIVGWPQLFPEGRHHAPRVPQQQSLDVLDHEVPGAEFPDETREVQY
jgi:hypothetical protein